MTARRLLIFAAVVLGLAAAPAPAVAFNPLKPVCGVLGVFNRLAGGACTVIQHSNQLIGAGKKLASGHPGAALKTLAGGGAGGASAGSGPSRASALISLAAVGAWVLGGAKFALHETAKVLGKTTTPQLRTTWFSAAYWRMAAIAAVLTLPFLFAAAIQALMRSDLTLLLRATLGYLPLAMLGVSIAAPLTMLLLVASDQMSAAVASATGNGGVHFLSVTGAGAGILSAIEGSPFLVFLVALFTAAAAIVLWVELLIRAAAVYVVVLMLPLAFAALVWPARRVWAIRAVELLVALILSKFAIVAVLALGGAALGHGGGGGISGMLAGFVLVLMAAFAPWALLRLLPLAELASGAAGSLRPELSRAAGGAFAFAEDRQESARDRLAAIANDMRRPLGEVPADLATDGATSERERLAELTAVAGSGGSVRSSNGTAASNGGEPEQAHRPVATNGRPESDGAAQTEASGEHQAVWDAADLSTTVTLGHEMSSPPPPADDVPPPRAGEDHPAPAGGDHTPLPGEDRRPPPGEDHNPLPPDQEPEDGRL